MAKWRFAALGLPAMAALVLAAGSARADNLVVNGGFESGNTGFTSEYTYSPGNLVPAGAYDIAGATGPENSAFTNFGPYDGSLMMIVNGADGANVGVWSEANIAVTPDTTYYFSTWIASDDSGNPANLDFSANGAQLGSTFNASATPGLWQEFYATWYSGSATDVILSLVNQNTRASGNDFALDDIGFGTNAPAGGTGTGGTGTDVPEPASAAIMAAGLLGLMGLGRFKRRST